MGTPCLIRAQRGSQQPRLRDWALAFTTLDEVPLSFPRDHPSSVWFLGYSTPAPSASLASFTSPLLGFLLLLVPTRWTPWGYLWPAPSPPINAPLGAIIESYDFK